MNKLLLTAAVVVSAAVALLLGGVFRESAASSARVEPSPADAFQPAFSTLANTAAFVADLESKLARKPDDADTRILLGLAYQQRARETSNFAYLHRSGRLLREVVRRDERNALALSGLGSLSLTLHRFDEGLHYGERAARLAPNTARHYGVVGDALLETGRYREAFKAFDTMVRLKPSVSSYARVAYARELLGNHRGAVTAMQLAIDAAVGAPEATAWAYLQFGKLAWKAGRVVQARDAYRAALLVYPGYADALDALAHVEAAEGHPLRALELARRAFAAKKTAEHAMTLADLYRIVGSATLARRDERRAIALEQAARIAGENTDLELALLRADLGLEPERTLRLARTAQHQRPSIDGDDVLAWALYRNGRCSEALTYSKRALRLGTLDALKFFHRGMIERCLGHAARSHTWLGRALETNPHFSLRWAPVARRLA